MNLKQMMKRKQAVLAKVKKLNEQIAKHNAMVNRNTRGRRFDDWQRGRVMLSRIEISTVR